MRIIIAPLLLYCIVLLLPCTACLKSRGHHYHTQPFATRVEAHLLRFYSFSFLMVLVDPCDRNYIHWQSSSKSATANINGGTCDEVKKLLWVCISQFSPKVAATLKQFQLCGGNMPLLQNCAHVQIKMVLAKLISILPPRNFTFGIFDKRGRWDTKNKFFMTQNYILEFF